MARVAVSMMGAQNLSDDTFRQAGAALAARTEVMGIGPIERQEGMAGMAAVIRTRVGPRALDTLLNHLGSPGSPISFGILAYGVLVYQHEDLVIPPPLFEHLNAALRSLARMDEGFRIPNLGNVSAHLSGSSDRHPH